MCILRSIKKTFLFFGIRLAFLTSFIFIGFGEYCPASAQLVEEEQGNSEDLLGKWHRKTNVSVKMKDDVWNNVRIESAALDGQDIHLKKHPNIFGVRGTLNVQLEPGEYTLRWAISKPSRKTRITLTYQKTFTVSPREGNVTIVVTGEKAVIY